MKNFKAGQKVVYDPSKGFRSRVPELVTPKDGEIVTIKCKCPDFEGAWIIYEYQISPKGVPQSFMEINLHPLEDYFKEQTESVVEKLESELQIEIPELV